MYARVEQVEALASDPNENRPVILCEYAHSMGNSTGNVDKYWSTFDRLEKCQGGFIWDWADQALIKRFTDKDGKSKESWAYGGDFGDFPNDAQFICNGVVFPDRSCKPAALEMKHVQSPISCSLLQKTSQMKDLEWPLRIKLQNKNFFTCTDIYDFTWRAIVNGNPAALYGDWQKLELGTVQPQSEASISLPIPLDEVLEMAAASKSSVAEVCIEIQCCLKHATNWVEKGHVVSIQQLTLPTQHRLQTLHEDQQEASRISIYEAGNTVTMRSVDGMHECEIDTITGSLIRYSVASGGENANILAAPITPCLYRAPTDNDRGGSGGKSYAARWKAAGLHCLETLADSCTVTPILLGDHCTGVACTFKMHPRRDQAQIEIHDEGVGVGEVGGSHWFAENDDQDEADDEGHDAPLHTESFDALIDVRVTYSFLSNGSLHSSWTIDASKSLPPSTPKGLYASLPRVGVRFAIPGDYKSNDWYGRGPQECYPDRKAGSRIGHFSAACLSDLHVPYIFPGECDGRSDVRWTRWSIPNSNSDDNTRGCITIAAHGSSSSIPETSAMLDSQDDRSANLGVQVSSSFYSLEDLENAKHEHDLDQSNSKIFVHVDAAHMGVGGDDSWSPTVHPEFLVPPGPYSLDLVIQANAHPESTWSLLLRRILHE
jgi:beta-galactosidase